MGSLRAGSYNGQLADAAIKHAPEGIEVDIYAGLADVPFTKTSTSPSSYHLPPTHCAPPCDLPTRCCLVAPKYNGTIPATVKNAMDWISRPYPSDAIVDKPVAVIGGSGGRCGGAWAHEDTRKTARIAGANVLNNVILSVLYGATPFATLGAATKSHQAIRRSRASRPIRQRLQ